MIPLVAGRVVRCRSWWHESDDGQRLICDLCPRHCALKPGERGFCFVRENRDGRVVSTTYGRSTGFCIDPIEKKPLNQFYPGTPVLSFGTPGCNLGCTFCQNWTMSRSRDVEAACEEAQPQAIAAAARSNTAAAAWPSPTTIRSSGRNTPSTPPGRATPWASRPWRSRPATSPTSARPAFYETMDAANVDLKGFTDEFYRQYCGGRLQPVFDTLRWLVHESRTWVEITNLIIPQANDSPEDIRRMCQWIAAELGAGRAAAFFGVSSRFQADRSRADAGGDAADGPRHRPRGRPALCLHGQRLRSRAAAHVLPRLRPGGDPARGIRGRGVRDSRRPVHPLPDADRRPVRRRGRAPGAAGECR